jgi:hypothetical protein
VGNSTSPSQGGASDMSFRWVDMSNYVGGWERFIGYSGPQNEVKILQKVWMHSRCLYRRSNRIVIREMKSAGLTFTGHHSD